MLASDPELESREDKESPSEQAEQHQHTKKLVLKRKRDQIVLSDFSKPKRALMNYHDPMGDGPDLDEEDIDDFGSPRLASSVVPQNNFYSAQMHAPKKLGIRGFKRKEVSREALLLQNWPILKQSVEAIQSNEKTSQTLEALYKIIENLCEVKVNLGGEIYSRLQELLRSNVASLRTMLNEQSEKDGDLFLSTMESIWTDYCQHAVMIRNIFLYLDRTYILQNTNVPSLWETSLNIYREEILDKTALKSRLVTELLRIVDDERKGAHINRILVRNLLRMLSSLQIYPQVFERDFLDASETLFNRLGDTKARELDTSDYFKYVAKQIEEESDRVDFYLDESTRKPLLSLLESTLISKHMAIVLTRGLDAILDENRAEDLSLIYSLITRVKDGQALLKGNFANYIKRVGKSMVMDTARDKNMVENLMALKNRLDIIVHDCFKNEEKYQQAEKDAFDYFVNTRPNKPAELIAKYMDAKLRTGNKESSDEELDKLMDRVITLFRFIQGKDVFEAFYKKDLAKRLLLGRSASVDAEKAMLCKLKQECGPGFTHKLESMFKDMELSIDLCQSFRQHVEHEVEQHKMPPIMEFNVNVLTLGQWPHYNPVELVLPCGMSRSLQLFQDFYQSKHQGRKLQWQHSLGHCVLKAFFRKGCTKELQVSLYQAVVLLLFNGCTELSFSDIQLAAKLDPKELKSTLFSLCHGKSRILLRSSKEKEMSPEDKFSVNSTLQEKLYRIKISQVQMKETEEEHQQTEEQINQDRHYQIDAGVVRIMKTRKTLTHQQLLTELFAQLRFSVKAADLKKRISSLIERDFIARDNDDHNIYKYVA